MVPSVVTALVRNPVMVPTAVLRSRVAKDAEASALRHENAVLRRQIARVRYQPADRIRLAALSRLVPQDRRREVCRTRRGGSAGVADVPSGVPDHRVRVQALRQVVLT
ncbi:hypothetical protein NMG29_31515 [Streptomyces cocklensis]|jgi:hypothetical protein|uniref:hypothetical protein n=1 Tax=Actinacidiphila cocklensis TaxID=887465 RepID=UPI00203CA259|nr:hypothetical protein [Actinacidiphila cocklensis]MDD1062673.1 hypothetical protein [Actinacidiphila cocklensis]WSX75451.1 hypothetical protein OH826_17025 [Streptomyces sp. NBC_00899]